MEFYSPLEQQHYMEQRRLAKTKTETPRDSQTGDQQQLDLFDSTHRIWSDINGQKSGDPAGRSETDQTT